VAAITRNELKKWCRNHSPQMSNAYDCFPVSLMKMWDEATKIAEEKFTSTNKQSAPCYRCSDYSTCENKIAHILPQCFKVR